MTWAHLKLRFSDFSNLLIIRKMLILFVRCESGWIIFVAGFHCFDTFLCSSYYISSNSSSRITFNDNGIFCHWKLRLPLNWKSIECLGHLRFSFFKIAFDFYCMAFGNCCCTGNSINCCHFNSCCVVHACVCVYCVCMLCKRLNARTC